MRSRRNRRGSAMIEFALSMLVLAPIAYGTLQYGYGFFLHNEISNATRAGARYASMKPLDASKIDEYKSAVRNMTVCGHPTGCAAEHSMVRGLAPEDVAVDIAFDRNVPARVTVRVESLPGGSIGGASIKPGSTFPYLGRWTP